MQTIGTSMDVEEHGPSFEQEVGLEAPEVHAKLI